MKTHRKILIFSLVTVALVLAGCASSKHVDAFRAVDNDTKHSGRLDLSIGSQSAFDETWIIGRRRESSRAANGSAGSGELMANIGRREIEMPLTHTEVKASLKNYMSTVEVQQRFENPYTQKIEATYVFPLPHNAAVNEFVMTIGKRRIRGIIRERTEAEAIYQEAKRQGYVVSLLDEELPNAFKQSIANIEPGNEIDVKIKYFQTLNLVDGWFQFVFPMAFGAGDQSAAAGNWRSGDVSLSVDLEAGASIGDVECRTHSITTNLISPGHVAVRLKSGAAIPNGDFVLRYRLAGDESGSSLMTHQDERGGYFTMMLYPPKDVGKIPRQPLETIFVLGCSSGLPRRSFEQATAAVARGLRLLGTGDTFQVIDCAGARLGPGPVEATPENVQRALNYLHTLNANGRVSVLDGLREALEFPRDAQRSRLVCFVTDCAVADEAGLLREIHGRLGGGRIFSLGVGPVANRSLGEQIAKAGRGAAAYVGPKDDAEAVMVDIFDRINHQPFTNIKINFGAMQASEVYPRELPDLFFDRPVMLTGRFSGSNAATIRVIGNEGNQRVEFAIPASASNTNSAVPNIWARMKMADLEEQSVYDMTPELPYKIKQLALDYGLVSPFTDFLTVDATGPTN
jgi:Ca-activated chloride channel family protein